MPRPHGTDQRRDRAARWCIRLVCGRPKTWLPENRRERGTAFHPGTAIRWEEDLWEVVSARTLPGGGVSYDLAPWDDQNAVRVLLPYDETSEAARRGGRPRRGPAAGRRGLTLVLAPVTGLLPGRVQERLGVELGIRPTTLTLASVLVPMAAGTFALVATLAAGLGRRAQDRGRGDRAVPSPGRLLLSRVAPALRHRDGPGPPPRFGPRPSPLLPRPRHRPRGGRAASAGRRRPPERTGRSPTGS